MAYAKANRVFETTTTTGTGSLNLAGTSAGFQTFVSGIGDGNTCHYEINNGTDWEVGIGTVTAGSPDVLSRDTVLESTNADAKVNWGSGTKNVFVLLSAQNTAETNANNSFTGNNAFSGDNTYTGDNDFSGGTITLPSSTFGDIKEAASATETGVVELSTDAELKTGTDTVRAVTPANIKNSLGFSNHVTLAEQTITAATKLTVAHGLGSIPLFCKVYLINKTTNLNYAVGDVVEPFNINGTGGADNGVSLSWDATNVYITTATNVPFLLNKDTGTGAPITASSWRYLVEVFG